MAEPAQKKARTSRTFLFSSESVNEGHPDKICDQVSDAVLDACLQADPKSKVACETATKDNMVMVAGEILGSQWENVTLLDLIYLLHVRKLNFLGLGY